MKKKLTKVAFLDRDGVLNSSKINNGYISKIKDYLNKSNLKTQGNFPDESVLSKGYSSTIMRNITPLDEELSAKI